MKQPNWILSLALAISLSTAFQARAELVSEEVLEDAITTEAEAASAEPAEEVVILKKAKKAAAPKRKVIVREVVEAEEQPVSAMEPAAVKKSAGSSIDAGIQTKMDSVRDQFEQALIRQLDKIKITVDDGNSVAQSTAPAATTIVQDSVVNTQGAPVSASGAANETYVSIDKAPVIADEAAAAEGVSVAEKEDDDSKLEGRVRIAPIAGWTSLASDAYNVDSRHTLGVTLEVDIDSNLSAAASYAFSQYDVAVRNNAFYNPALFNNNTRSLEYNQNVFDGTLRFYLLPKKSRFRAFLGGGAGFNKGYLNYDQNTLNTFANDPNLVNSGELDDYEVTSFLGILEAGSELQLSKAVAVGGLFKYSNVLNSRENKRINNNVFLLNGLGNNFGQPKEATGGSIAKDNFYSILGTVKVAF